MKTDLQCNVFVRQVIHVFCARDIWVSSVCSFDRTSKVDIGQVDRLRNISIWTPVTDCFSADV